MNYDNTVNNILNEKFGTPGKARKRQAVGVHMTSRDPNAWKDPLKKHHMKDVRGVNRKKVGWVPKTHQTDPSIALGQRVLDLAKDADQGIWEIGLGEAIPIAKKYKMNIPNAKKPARRLGSTGIVMYLRWDNTERRYRLFLIKHDKLLRSGVALKKRMKRGGQSRVSASKSSKGLKYPKRPKKPMSPMFNKGKVERF